MPQVAVLMGSESDRDIMQNTAETLEKVYGCHVDLIAHGHPHRVLSEHSSGGGSGERP